MGSKKEINNNKKLEETKLSDKQKKLDKKIFQRIKNEFKQYQKYLFGLIFVYIICYSIWFLSAEKIGGFIRNHGYDENSRILVIGIAILQGLLFCLDGFVTALLKSPFNQMCFAINKAEGIPYEKKGRIILLATRANEHCKETLKKLGVISILNQITTIFILGGFISETKKYGPYADWLYLSYLVPIIFTTIDMMSISRELKKIKKELVVSHGKKESVTTQSD